MYKKYCHANPQLGKNNVSSFKMDISQVQQLIDLRFSRPDSAVEAKGVIHCLARDCWLLVVDMLIDLLFVVSIHVCYCC